MIHEDRLPETAALKRYARGAGYTDCYRTDIPGSVTLETYVRAFYTTGLFKLERRILAVLARKPSTDRDAEDLASGASARFAVWSVEQRTADELLMRDDSGATRTWLMAVPDPGAGTTQLFLGSAVVPVVDAKTGRERLGPVFHALLGFHKLYSRLLLRAARSRLERARA